MLLLIATLIAPAREMRAQEWAKAGERDAVFAYLDRIARTWLASSAGGGITEHQISNSVFSRDIVLYLVPSGRLAFPYTYRATDRDRIRFVLVHPDLAGINFVVNSCSAPKLDNTLNSAPQTGSAALASSAPGGADQTMLDVAKATFPPTTPFTAEAVSQPRSCADSIRVQSIVRLSLPQTSHRSAEEIADTTITTVRVANTYLYQVSAGFGFDFGHPTQISLAERPNAAATGTEKYLVSRRDVNGPGMFAAFAFHPCGLDVGTVKSIFSRATVINPCELMSFSLGVPSQGHKTAFVVGLPLIEAYGAGVILGFSVSKVDYLREDVNRSIADTSKVIGIGRTYTLSGDPPVDSRFAGKGMGWFIGFNASTEALGKLFSAGSSATGGKGATSAESAPPKPK
jgi:hypothetical protein